MKIDDRYKIKPVKRFEDEVVTYFHISNGVWMVGNHTRTQIQKTVRLSNFLVNN